VFETGVSPDRVYDGLASFARVAQALCVARVTLVKRAQVWEQGLT
jgi:hypothetical protein